MPRGDVDRSVRNKSTKHASLSATPTITSSHSPQHRQSSFLAASRHSPPTASEPASRKSPAPATSRSLPLHSQPSATSIQYLVSSLPSTARPRATGGRFVGKADGPGDAQYKPSAIRTTENLKEEAERFIGGATGRGGRRKKE